MEYVLTLLVGLVAGAACTLLILLDWHRRLKAQLKSASEDGRRAAAAKSAAATKEAEVAQRSREFELYARGKHAELNKFTEQLREERARFDQRVVTYDELRVENGMLKRDLQNIDVNLHKVELDGQLREERQQELDRRSTALARRYLTENVKLIVSSIGPSNFTGCKNRLIEVIARVRELGYEVTTGEEEQLLADLRGEFERAVRAEFQRQEQARIRAQIREEERLKREAEREIRQLERERLAIQAALDQALAEARGLHSAEVERLQTRLAEAEEKSKRAMSMAQITKAGHVYVISNIGTMGEGIFKIGMTRRLKPEERIDELGCASVPFPFDVHMMIQCDNAPALENALHRALHRQRINRANPRKEFFRTDIEEINRLVKQHHGEVVYQADAEALEYRQTLQMSEEDAQFIEHVYELADEEEQPDYTD